MGLARPSHSLQQARGVAFGVEVTAGPAPATPTRNVSNSERAAISWRIDVRQMELFLPSAVPI